MGGSGPEARGCGCLPDGQVGCSNGMSVKYTESSASLSHGINRVGEPAVGEGKKKSSREFLVIKDVIYLIGLEGGPTRAKVSVIKKPL